MLVKEDTKLSVEKKKIMRKLEFFEYYNPNWYNNPNPNATSRKVSLYKGNLRDIKRYNEMIDNIKEDINSYMEYIKKMQSRIEEYKEVIFARKQANRELRMRGR